MVTYCIKQMVWNTTLIIALLIGSLSLLTTVAEAASADVELSITGSISVQLNNVPSTMSDDIRTLYENTMTEFYRNSYTDMKNITVKMIQQKLESEPESRLRSNRRIQQQPDAAPLNTILTVSGIRSDSSITSTLTTNKQFNNQLLSDTIDNTDKIINLLKAADSTYFHAINTSHTRFSIPQQVENISIITLCFIAILLGVCILLLYPEEKVPENWRKSV